MWRLTRLWKYEYNTPVKYSSRNMGSTIRFPKIPVHRFSFCGFRVWSCRRICRFISVQYRTFCRFTFLFIKRGDPSLTQMFFVYGEFFFRTLFCKTAIVYHGHLCAVCVFSLIFYNEIRVIFCGTRPDIPLPWNYGRGSLRVVDGCNQSDVISRLEEKREAIVITAEVGHNLQEAERVFDKFLNNLICRKYFWELIGTFQRIGSNLRENELEPNLSTTSAIYGNTFKEV